MPRPPRHGSAVRLAGCVLATAALAVGLSACGGDSDDESDAATTTETEATTTADGGVLPEIVAATEQVVAHLEAEGAVPDPEARARVRDRFEASKRLIFPAGGPDCRIREIAAGSARLVTFTQRAPIYEHVVTDEEETVAVALNLPTIDPDAPASVRCIDAVSAALATLDGGAAAPTTTEAPPSADERPTIEIRGSGVTTSTGGFFTGALVENTGPEGLRRVEVGFDVLNAAGRVIGSAQPAVISVLPAGATAAAATNTTETECGCVADDIASVRTRFRAAGMTTGDVEVATVTDATITTDAGELVISGTIENPDATPLTDPVLSYVVLDANGIVMSGNFATLIGVEVPAEGSAPFERTPPASFGESLPREPAEVVVSVVD